MPIAFPVMPPCPQGGRAPQFEKCCTNGTAVMSNSGIGHLA